MYPNFTYCLTFTLLHTTERTPFVSVQNIGQLASWPIGRPTCNMLDGGGEVNMGLWDKGKHPEWINTTKDKSYTGQNYIYIKRTNVIDQRMKKNTNTICTSTYQPPHYNNSIC